MKILKGLLIGAAVLALVGYFGFNFMKSQTKKASPEEVATYQLGDAEITIDYSRPTKKGRVIFGELVPYGKVWRTGANEATTFTTTKDLKVGGLPLTAGTYTLWTIPQADSWTVIFNSKMYPWGVNYDGDAQRDPTADVVKVEVPIQVMPEVAEQFTITVGGEPTALAMAWDLTKVRVPLTR
ncbi:MAG TPA: DUF2911 domain-containing protein [Flavobacteriales bacterium]|jgi:hypothetical protein|nr:DUF2911 domain-containing protein [Flavobacteriales bacterium]MBK6549711.1 DUF2911 domain-containing protein [Flavobacteriales bacterium]MBK7102227.1 DUF2911 domain-containing protein [Flavobacteriales bacterium]MBK7112966.1 DUF2911 domain-containing protein [Flavobacteriales bacterium]MBK7619201.1 DUF2911 domain-containing protein [Flavobacteriales bacterium]